MASWKQSWPRRRQGALLHAPDLLVLVSVIVAGIELVLRAAVLFDVLRREQMHVRHVAARLLASEGAVDFVDHDPALKVERLCDGGKLILLVADALERRLGAV